ncbi:Allo54 [Silurid herpesvirus 1]|nr:Allo54 [Silurid herpesvirus 1]
MGIKKKLVQSLIFNSISQNRFGLIVQNKLVGKASALIFDHMLVMHSACYVPVQNQMGPEEHILHHALNHYTKYLKGVANSSTVFILCEDGFQSVKPAVRDKRSEQIPTEALVYFKNNKSALARTLVERLQMEGVCALFITGYNGTSLNYRYLPGNGTRPRLGAELHMESFIQECKEVEADLLMYAIAAQYNRYFPNHLIVITTRDTDVIPTGLALMREMGSEYLGNTVLEFKTPMFAGTKDYDRAVSDFLLVEKVSLSNTMIFNRFARFTVDDFYQDDGLGGGTISGDIFNLLLDTRTLSAFSDLLTRLYHTITSYEPEEVKKLIKFFIACLRAGFRGPVFRRILMRLLDEDLTTRDTVEKFMKELDSVADRYELLSDFFTKTNSYVAGKLIKYLSDDCDWDVIDDSDQTDALGHFIHGQAYMVTTTGLSARCVKGLVALAKMYRDNKISLGSYGAYIGMQSTHGNCYIRLVPTPSSPAAMVACVLAGADYNLTIPKLGSVQIVNLLTEEGFLDLCTKHSFTLEEDGASFMWKMLSMTKLKRKLPLDPRLDEYVMCVWKTMCYTIHTWQLKAPKASIDYGFVGGDVGVNFSIKDPQEFKNAFTLSRK